MVGHCLLLYFLMLKINVKFLFSHLDLVTLMATGQHVLHRFRIGLHHFQFEKRRAEKEAKFLSVGSNAAYSFGGGGGGWQLLNLSFSHCRHNFRFRIYSNLKVSESSFTKLFFFKSS